ncbi:pyrroloquinoline quinone biosynthesis peptide chaperone PqqD [Actinophytocola gossypii]|uniref:Pyrroloquinoline quinone biosynthesis peptide chaperone PqqD n=1 Tax=Actinophytocola gossypii TaxID=2812003 RepID=A0ABT2J5R6_9PSEU|nr:pyrroloquinoline quinone biosynthesis peptide chaperone PqqD [Actinophytocola gossypii]MCT2583206.1 pyrroloquinoline quinone biosynthesis peptide chaperone PqqD [Actinophytocola gossypii]
MVKPRLRTGVRLTFDRVRDTHVLLFPEGVLVPNATAAAVLELCDGSNEVGEIADRLGARFRGVRVEDVAGVLARFEDRRVVEWT